MRFGSESKRWSYGLAKLFFPSTEWQVIQVVLAGGQSSIFPHCFVSVKCNHRNNSKYSQLAFVRRITFNVRIIYLIQTRLIAEAGYLQSPSDTILSKRNGDGTECQLLSILYIILIIRSTRWHHYLVRRLINVKFSLTHKIWNSRSCATGRINKITRVKSNGPPRTMEAKKSGPGRWKLRNQCENQ